jgi:hypothetical protein
MLEPARSKYLAKDSLTFFLKSRRNVSGRYWKLRDKFQERDEKEKEP